MRIVERLECADKPGPKVRPYSGVQQKRKRGCTPTAQTEWGDDSTIHGNPFGVHHPIPPHKRSLTNANKGLDKVSLRSCSLSRCRPYGHRVKVDEGAGGWRWDGDSLIELLSSKPDERAAPGAPPLSRA